MARRKGKKSNTIILIILLLLLLVIGWRVWLWSTNRETTVSQANGGAPAATTIGVPSQPAWQTQPAAPVASSLPLPNISFSMPPMRPPPQPEAAPIAPPPAVETTTRPAAQPVTASRSTAVKTPPRAAVVKPRRPPESAAAAAQRVARAPTRPPPEDTLPVVTFGYPGSQIDGYATIRNKFHDTANARYLVSCTTDGSNLIYIYEVDAETYEEARPGLLYNPAKVSRWKFVSSR